MRIALAALAAAEASVMEDRESEEDEALILTTRKYDVRTTDGVFGLYLSCHPDSTCFAGVCWYRKTGSWENGEGIDLDIDLKTFASNSEAGGYEEAVSWIKDNLDAEAEIVEREA